MSKQAQALGMAIMLVLVVAYAIVAAYLSKPGIVIPPQRSDIEVAVGWLECIDCQGPFLRALKDLPQPRQDSVVRFLSTALRQGPDSARRARLERDLLRAWISESLYRERMHISVVSANQHAALLNRYRQGLYTKWRGRAAIALGVIHSDSARAALDSASQVPDTSASDSLVKKLIERARSDSLRLEPLQLYP